MRQLGAELEVVVGVETTGASQKRDALVYQDVSSAFGRNFGHGNGVHACAPAETVSEKENVGVSLLRNREGGEIFNADRDARFGGLGEREDGPAHCLPGRLACLALDSTSRSPPCALIHADPPNEALDHRKRARDSKVAGGVEVAGLHDPWPHEE